MSEQEFDGATLREVFEACAKNQQGWLLPLSDYRHPWRLLYMAITDKQSGLAAAKHEEWQGREIARLQQEVDRLRCLLDDRKPDYIKPEVK